MADSAQFGQACVAGEDRDRDGSEYPLDARTPSVARVCDAFLGGKDSFGGIARKA
jgi:hypothetical protein